MIKIRHYASVFFMIILLCFVSMAACEQQPVMISVGEEWTWKKGEDNIFSGEIDLSAYTGQEVTVSISSDLPFSSEEEDDSHPVFTIVNGKRIPMLKQNCSFQCIPETENTVIPFSGKLKMPANKRVGSIVFSFKIEESNGQEMSNMQYTIDNSADKNGNIYYISADIHLISAIIFLAAAGIWLAVMIRNRNMRKNHGLD